MPRTELKSTTHLRIGSLLLIFLLLLIIILVLLLILVLVLLAHSTLHTRLHLIVRMHTLLFTHHSFSSAQLKTAGPPSSSAQACLKAHLGFPLDPGSNGRRLLHLDILVVFLIAVFLVAVLLVLLSSRRSRCSLGSRHALYLLQPPQQYM